MVKDVNFDALSYKNFYSPYKSHLNYDFYGSYQKINNLPYITIK